MKDRLIGVDLLKIISAFAVVLIHTHVPNMSSRACWLSILPDPNVCFALVAGFFLWRVCMRLNGIAGKWFVRRIMRLVVPYLIWEAIYILVNFFFDILQHGTSLWEQDMLSVLGLIFWGGGSVQLWFVITLFYVQCCYMLIALVCGERKILLFAGAAVAMVLCGFGRNCSGIFFPLRRFFFIGVFCGVGMIFGFLVEQWKAWKWRGVLIALVAMLLALQLKDVRSVIWFAVFYFMSICLVKESIGRCARSIGAIAELTMGIYLVHMLVCRIFSVMSDIFDVWHTSWLLPLSAFACFVVSAIIVRMGSRYKFLWGE